jgi:hypothetical protein
MVFDECCCWSCLLSRQSVNARLILLTLHAHLIYLLLTSLGKYSRDQTSGCIDLPMFRPDLAASAHQNPLMQQVRLQRHSTRHDGAFLCKLGALAKTGVCKCSNEFPDGAACALSTPGGIMEWNAGYTLTRKSTGSRVCDCYNCTSGMC